MAKTESTMVSLGTKAPSFKLQDVVSNEIYELSSFDDKKALLVMFICKHCPYVQHIRKQLTNLGHDYTGHDVAIIAISSNDAATYPDDSPESLATFAGELELTYPLLYDESQEVAKAYTAACTPDFFLFDGTRSLVYRGQLDDSRPGNNKPNDGHDLRAALDAVLAGNPINPDQKPSIGCNIKWRSGNEPPYTTELEFVS